MPASAEPMANVIDIVEFTFIPISCAAPLSSDTALIDFPIFVKFINTLSTAIIKIQASTVNKVSGATTSLPSKNLKLSILSKTDVNTLQKNKGKERLVSQPLF